VVKRVLVLALAACNAVLGHERGELDPPGATPVTFSALGDLTQWASADPPTSPGYGGFAFDGRWVYAPSSSALSGIVSRYDTKSPFGASAWQSFDIGSLDARCKGFAGATFDGRYVYLVPHSNGSALGIVARFDSNGALGDATSWSLFDVSALDSAARGFQGGSFDGRFAYFVPSFNYSGRDGVVARLDTRGAFATPSSWSTFDVATLDPRAKGFFGSAFDGRFVYFVPNVYGEPHGLVVRLDATASFGDASSWAVVDLTTIFGAARGFAGAVFDGRYLYLAPIDGGGPAARLDTHADMGSAAAWSFASLVAARTEGFAGAEFDGRYVYFVPTRAKDGALDLLRYDTKAAFATSSFETFDMHRVAPSASGFLGGGFDGTAIFLAPSNGAPFLRFTARTPAGKALPPSSFF
jgi:hypothetical protein